MWTGKVYRIYERAHWLLHWASWTKDIQWYTVHNCICREDNWNYWWSNELWLTNNFQRKKFIEQKWETAKEISSSVSKKTSPNSLTEDTWPKGRTPPLWLLSWKLANKTVTKKKSKKKNEHRFKSNSIK